jgi:hypothetical protein
MSSHRSSLAVGHCCCLSALCIVLLSKRVFNFTRIKATCLNWWSIDYQIAFCQADTWWVLSGCCAGIYLFQNRRKIGVGKVIHHIPIQTSIANAQSKVLLIPLYSKVIHFNVWVHSARNSIHNLGVWPEARAALRKCRCQHCIADFINQVARHRLQARTRLKARIH